MRMWLAGIALAGACGAQSTNGSNTPPPFSATPRPQHTVKIGALCARMTELHDASCGLFAEAPLDTRCEQEVTGSMQDPGNRATTTLMDLCTSELTNCNDVTACIGSIEASPDVRDCNDHSESKLASAVGMPYDAWRTEMKRGLTKYSEVTSSKAQPIELCGVTTENYWVTTLACDDGSHPFKKHTDAEKTRMSNAGAGGRCNSIIDHYRVTCPEHPYDLYLDSFVCPNPEQ
jgi:hypothetical protein